MPLGLGLAYSHSPILFRPRSQWEAIYEKLIGSVPQPNRATAETPEVLDSYFLRIESAFAGLRYRLEAYRPEAIVMVVSDRGRVFGPTQTPQLNVYVGSDLWGSTRYPELGEKHDESTPLTVPCHSELSAWLVDELTEEGFDMNVSRTFKPMGDPAGGTVNAITDTVQKLTPRLKVPIVPLYVNAHRDPAISGHRMPPLGKAIAKVMGERPERIALIACGGLSGNPQGYLAGWVDETLDQWVMSRLSRGRSEQLNTLWDLDSDTVRGQTREIRNWIVVGAAMEAIGTKATFLDYIPFHHSTVGTAFAHWLL